MGRRGPATKPVAIKKMQGTLNVTRDKDDFIDASSLRWVHNDIVDPPESLPPIGADLWRRQIAQAQALYGYISFIDLIALEEYCHTYAMLHSIRGRLYSPPKDKKYDMKDDYRNYHKLASRFDTLTREFGFTPSARTRIRLEQKDKDDYDEFDDVTI